MSVKQSDSTSERCGFLTYEHIGVGIMNVYAILPWYKKIFYKQFYRDLYYKMKRKLMRKYESTFKKENKRSKEKNVRD